MTSHDDTSLRCEEGRRRFNEFMAVGLRVLGVLLAVLAVEYVVLFWVWPR